MIANDGLCSNDRFSKVLGLKGSGSEMSSKSNVSTMLLEQLQKYTSNSCRMLSQRCALFVAGLPREIAPERR